MDGKKIKRNSIIIAIVGILLIIIGSSVSDYLSKFFSGFIAGVATTLIGLAVIYFVNRFKKK